MILFFNYLAINKSNGPHGIKECNIQYTQSIPLWIWAISSAGRSRLQPKKRDWISHPTYRVRMPHLSVFQLEHIALSSYMHTHGIARPGVEASRGSRNQPRILWIAMWFDFNWELLTSLCLFDLYIAECRYSCGTCVFVFTRFYLVQIVENFKNGLAHVKSIFSGFAAQCINTWKSLNPFQALWY